MPHEQTRREHTAQRDMVNRSLLLAPNRQDRSEERVRARRRVKAVPVVVRAAPPRDSFAVSLPSRLTASAGHVYVFPTVNGHPL